MIDLIRENVPILKTSYPINDAHQILLHVIGSDQIHCPGGCKSTQNVYVRYFIDDGSTYIQYMWLARHWLDVIIKIVDDKPVCANIDGNIILVSGRHTVYMSQDGLAIAHKPGTYCTSKFGIVAIPNSATSIIAQPVLLQGSDRTILYDPGFTGRNGSYLKQGSIEGDPRLLEADWKSYGPIPEFINDKSDSTYPFDKYCIIFIIIFIGIILFSAHAIFVYRAHDILVTDDSVRRIMA